MVKYDGGKRIAFRDQASARSGELGCSFSLSLSLLSICYPFVWESLPCHVPARALSSERECERQNRVDVRISVPYKYTFIFAK